MRSVVAVAVVALGLGAGCRKSARQTAPAPSAGGSEGRPAAAAPPRCRAPHPGALFTLGERSPTPRTSDDEDDGGDADELGLPFAVDVGSAVGYGGGFAVSALRRKQGKTSAVVALVAADGGSGRLVELGVVYGDAEPPRLAARGSQVIVGLPGNDAGGTTLRLIALDDASNPPGVKRGAEFRQGRDESQVFGLEVGERRGLMVWDEWDESAKHGVVRATSFAPDDLSNATRAKSISPRGDDVEAPRVVARPGGFWVAWLSHRSAEARDPDAGLTLVELGERSLELVPLDENGVATAAPTAVTAKGAHVLAFDLARAPDGGALLAWRDDESAPGAESRIVHLAHVAPSGAVRASVIDDEGVGAGVPSLLVERSAPPAGGPAAWLTLAGVSDATRLAALGPSGSVVDRVDTEPLLRRAEPLALYGGALLVGEPKGLAMELSVISCSPGAPEARDAGAAR
ncbi:MAG: hypothetical protein OZ921_10825 [Sorangiineae bacterium]|nr:hypothetical protein [Polyangiaceae bacterium]MEB2323000.1 hypothetical protein [Sorangiineae bacterium]